MAMGAPGFVMSGPDMAAEVADLCNGAPDIVFECVGKRRLIDACLGLVRSQGRVISVGLRHHTTQCKVLILPEDL